MDRGYNDSALFGRRTAGCIYFVTRMKGSPAWAVVEEKRALQSSHILADEVDERGDIGVEARLT